MNIRIYTDEELSELQVMPKRVLNPKARWIEKPGGRPVHRQRTYKVYGQSYQSVEFLVYQRQSIEIDCNFSCGISYLTPGSRPLTLARYNGPSHTHGEIVYQAHIHRTSERALTAGNKPESEAEVTSRFETLEGALACLMEDYSIVE